MCFFFKYCVTALDEKCIACSDVQDFSGKLPVIKAKAGVTVGSEIIKEMEEIQREAQYEAVCSFEEMWYSNSKISEQC